jgi:hypothetical protein
METRMTASTDTPTSSFENTDLPAPVSESDDRGFMTSGREVHRPISPAQHAVLDYGVAATFFAVGFALGGRNRRAAALAFLNGGMVLGMSMLTAYPGGLVRKLSFRQHRTGDMIQAGLAAAGPALFGFAGDSAANFFYAQALSEVGVISATDWDAA